MPENTRYRDGVDRLLVGGAFYGEDLDIAEEGKVPKEESLGLG